MNVRTPILAFFLFCQIHHSPSYALDKSRWLGGEATTLEAALADFKDTCLRVNQPWFSGSMSGVHAASFAKSHCACIAAFLEQNQDLTYVQVINASLKERVGDDLPDELSAYLEGYEYVFLECEKDLSWTKEGPTKSREFTPTDANQR